MSRARAKSGGGASPRQKRSPLHLEAEERSRLEAIVERSRILLAYADGEAIASIARRLETSRPKVQRTIDRALRVCWVGTSPAV